MVHHNRLIYPRYEIFLAVFFLNNYVLKGNFCVVMEVSCRV